MKFCTPINSKEELLALADSQIHEVLLGHSDLSRFGELSTLELLELTEMAQKMDMTPVLVWDRLLTENEFVNCLETLEQLNLNLFSSTRVQDIGAAQYILEKYPHLKIQLVLDSGNHNFIGIKSWEEFFGAKLERLVLSVEITKEKLNRYLKDLKTPVEIQGLGPLLLFTTPRKLLGQYFEDEESFRTEVSSEESPHKGFQIYENSHGTSMFHFKDLFLGEFVHELAQAGLSYMRLEHLFNTSVEDCKHFTEIISRNSEEAVQKFKELYPNKVMRGLFITNKTDILFDKISNPILRERNEDFFGEVMAVERDKYLVIKQFSSEVSAKPGDELFFATPDGKQKSAKISFMEDLYLNKINCSVSGSEFLMNYIRSIPPKSLVYFAPRS